ncbi:MAG: hypothetical protein M1829_003768 [Trizodia sp. TS-e1964]|nr:MAG: hypothetical protein M1829_003768 [Trizodia sp. TS-e1964]
MDPSSAPLADYFWIAGVDSLSYGARLNHSISGEKNINGVNGNNIAPPVTSTIEEDRALETLEYNSPRDHVRNSITPSENADLPDSFHRLSSLSNEARQSIQTINTPDLSPSSNRSSTTIKGVPLNLNGHNSLILNDFDFDNALRKFASERESFLDELSFSAGAFIPAKANKPSRAQKIVNEDTNGLGRGGGSIRRRISFRDLNSMRRQPSTVARSASVRTSKRLSNYNSVIPAPQPLDASPNMHPLKRRFEPVLLDRYPPKSMADEVKRRGAFPDYVPMFAFPNDINIVSADERPRSTWHGFAMTGGDNAKLYGICVIIWMPLNPEAAEDVERRCEEWRRDNMSNEERELASSLGERLAVERAKLSQLLAKLPSVSSGSPAREALEDQISETEERIGLMTDMLRPVRHGAAAKIDGLTDGETGLWIPRSYGILGRDPALTSFWKEWLRAIIVPMTNGSVLRVPPSSPKIGMWQPLERYVVNLCAEALSPASSKTQVEVAVRELRLFARKEAINELPGSRNTDLYALFRCLSIQNIVVLFEVSAVAYPPFRLVLMVIWQFLLSESRVILLSSHTSMLHLVSRAMSSLLYPLSWAGIFIPVLPARLLSALEAPCPYLVGVERRYDKIEFPEDDYVAVDLDENEITSTSPPTSLPRQNRRKLVSILQLAAPHHIRFGVPIAPPAYAIETFPYDAFASESPSLFNANAPPSTLAKYVALNSTSFGANGLSSAPRPSVFNAFLQSKNDHSRRYERPSTSSTKNSSPPSPKEYSPVSVNFPSMPTTPASRNDSGYALTATLKEKRSGHFDNASRRSSSVGYHPVEDMHRNVVNNQQFGFERAPTLRRPSLPFVGHGTSLSTSTSSFSTDDQSTYHYAPSTYAQSTLAASTIMPHALVQPVRNTDSTSWVEGHCLQWQPKEDTLVCSVCDEKADEGIYKCNGCGIIAHSRCAGQICIVCPVAFYPDQIRAAFVRCYASLFYTYRKFLQPATATQKKAGKIYHFNMNGFLKSMPSENADYMAMLRETQGFNEFIAEREVTKGSDPSIMLFDEIILSKKNRGRTAIFSKSRINFLQDTSEHLWRSAMAAPPSSRFPGDYRQVVSRTPAKLDPILMKEPRVIQGVPRLINAKARRKPIPSMLGPGTKSNGPSSPTSSN